MTGPGRALTAAFRLLRAGQVTRARARLASVCCLDTSDPTELCALGAMKYELEDLEGAQEALLRCLEVEPAHPLAHATLSEIAAQRHDAAGAEEHAASLWQANDEALAPMHRWMRRVWRGGEGRLPANED